MIAHMSVVVVGKETVSEQGDVHGKRELATWNKAVLAMVDKEKWHQRLHRPEKQATNS
jgi:hypothetical protein